MGVEHCSTDNAFHTAGAAKALTTSYVAGDVLGPHPANVMALNVTLAATVDPASVEVMVERSPDGTNYFPEEAVNSVASGVVDLDDGVWSPDPTAGNKSINVAVRPGMFYRLKAKYTAAGTDPTALITATFTRE